MSNTSSWLDKLNAMSETELLNSIPEENEQNAEGQRYTPKTLGVGSHHVNITSISRVIDGDKVYLEIEVADAVGSKHSKHRQYIFNREGTKFNIFYELFLRSLGDFNKADKAYLGRMILQDGKVETVLGANLVVTIDHKEEGIIIKKDFESKRFICIDNNTKKTLFVDKEFKSFEEANNFIKEFNLLAEAPLMMARKQIMRYEKDNAVIEGLKSNIEQATLDKYLAEQTEMLLKAIQKDRIAGATPVVPPRRSVGVK